jgi:hypothetical protein
VVAARAGEAAHLSEVQDAELGPAQEVGAEEATENHGTEKLDITGERSWRNAPAALAS